MATMFILVSHVFHKIQ